MGFNPRIILSNICLLLVISMTLLYSCKRDDPPYNDNYDIVISTPKAGAVLNKGEAYSIKWETTKAENLKIMLYKQDDPVSIISISEINSGEFIWLIPESIKPDTNYRIRITGNDNKTLSGFSHFFIISGDSDSKYIKIADIQTNNWVKGGDSLITWTDNIEEDVRIDIFLDNVFYANIVEQTPSTGSFLWSIPTTLPSSSNYNIKISSKTDQGIYSLSDIFRISLETEMNLVKNGNFINQNYWYFSNPLSSSINRWNISTESQSAELVSLQSSGSIIQELGLIPGQRYIIGYTLSKCNGYIGGAQLNQSDSSRAAIICAIGNSYGERRYKEGTYSDTITAAGTAIEFIIYEQASSFPNTGFICKMDNVEVFPE
ncbi:MAG: GPI anchored serine-threonine rich family protein [Bacteroidota bacterium]|nr:GPI anchored serine-threonine rich family protein [Bacteroidota bacterium]